jgi:hypothetical protein
MDVVKLVDMTLDTDPGEYAPGVGLVTIGEDEAAAGQSGQQAGKPVVALNAIEGDIVNVIQKIVRVDAMLLHQPGKRGPVRMKMRFLDPLRFIGAAVEQLLDIGAHALVDQREETCGGGVEAIVEVEDPVANVRKARVHAGEALVNSTP